MSEHGHGHHEEEKKPEAAVERKADVSPAISRVVGAAIEPELLNPTTKTISDEKKAALKTAGPEALDPVLKAANSVSMDSRREYDKHDKRELDVRVKEWTDKFVRGVTGFTNVEHVEEDLAKSRTDALASVGINVNADHHTLEQQVEAFRKKYVAEDKSDIGLFVKDLAEGCKEGDTINLDTLAQRLQDIQLMLNVFGKVNNVNKLVDDFAMAYGILSQKGAAKEAWVDKATDHIKNRPLPDEHVRLKAVWDKIVDESVKGIPLEESGEVSQTQSNAEKVLGRPLTDDEKQQIQDGKSSKEIVYAVKKRIREDVGKVNIIPATAMQSPDTPNDAKLGSMIHGFSPNEVGWIYETLGLNDPEELKEVVDSLQVYADAAKKFDTQFVFGVPIVLNAEGKPVIGNTQIIGDNIAETDEGNKIRQQIHEEAEKMFQQKEGGEGGEDGDNPPPLDTDDHLIPEPDEPESKSTRPPYTPDQSRIDLAQEERLDAHGGEYSLKHEKGGDKNREDRVVYDPEHRMFATIDGVSQSPHSDVSAEFAKEYLLEAAQYIPDGLTLEQTQRYLQRLVMELNTSMKDRTEGKTTLSLGYIYEAPDGTKKLITVNIGDSRIYRMRGNTVEPITTDDLSPYYPRDEQMALQRKLSEVATMDDINALTPGEKIAWGTRNQVDQAMGSSLVEPDIMVHDIQDGDIFIGTTDGIHDNLTDSEIQDILRANPDPQEALRQLVIKSRDRGRGADPDNRRAKKDDISGFIVKVDSTLPAKPPAKSAGDVADPNSPWGENQGAFTWNLEKVKQLERKAGRELTPVEQKYLLDGQPIENLDHVERVEKARKRAYKRKITQERLNRLFRDMKDLHDNGQDDSDAYKDAAAEIQRAQYTLDSEEDIAVYAYLNGGDEDYKNQFIARFRDAEAKKPAGQRTQVRVRQIINPDDTRGVQMKIQYVPDTSTTAAAA